jgi:hypothetical protein
MGGDTCLSSRGTLGNLLLSVGGVRLRPAEGAWLTSAHVCGWTCPTMPPWKAGGWDAPSHHGAAISVKACASPALQASGTSAEPESVQKSRDSLVEHVPGRGCIMAYTAGEVERIRDESGPDERN